MFFFLCTFPLSKGTRLSRCLGMGLHKLGRYAYSLVDVATSGQTFHVYMKLKGDCVRTPHAQDDNHASNMFGYSASLFPCLRMCYGVQLWAPMFPCACVIMTSWKLHRGVRPEWLVRGHYRSADRVRTPG